MRRGGLHYYSTTPPLRGTPPRAAPTTPPLRGTPPRAGGELYFAPLLFKEGSRVATGWSAARPAM
jgi:hypothetical protein